MFSAKRLLVHLRKRLPPREQVVNHWAIRPFAHYVNHPRHWLFHRNGVCKGIFIGIVCAWIPIPGQMLIAVIWAAMTRANIPTAITLTWVTNPFTFAPLFLLAGFIGNWLVNSLVPDWHTNAISLQDLWPLEIHSLATLLVGCVTLGLLTATAAWFIAQRLWRQAVVLRIRKKKRRRELARELAKVN